MSRIRRPVAKRCRASRPRQLGLDFRTWGGARKGAGRKPTGPKAGVSHRRRPALASRFPVHVTIRMLPHVWNLRSRRSFAVIFAAARTAANHLGTRLCEISIQGNHLHLIAEARDQPALSSAMKGLGVRLARGLNKLMGRRGAVVADRYHARILRTPTEVKRAVAYVRGNFRSHILRRGGQLGRTYVDPYSSQDPELGQALPRPGTWLLRSCIEALAAGPDG